MFKNSIYLYSVEFCRFSFFKDKKQKDKKYWSWEKERLMVCMCVCVICSSLYRMCFLVSI
jgi:hypothetical protein